MKDEKDDYSFPIMRPFRTNYFRVPEKKHIFSQKENVHIYFFESKLLFEIF